MSEVPSGDVKELAKEIRTRLLEEADSKYLAQLERLVPDVDSIGVKVPVIRSIATDFSKQLSLQFQDACALLDHLASKRSRDEFIFGIFLLSRYRKDLKVLTPKQLDRWSQEISTWETCDQFAANIAAPVIATDPDTTDQLFKWTTSSNYWLRRLAAATSATLSRRTDPLSQVVFKVCASLVSDSEPMVRKAVGWALREATKNHPNEVFDFLLKHAPTMDSSLLRESSKKLTPAKQKDLAKNI